MAPGGSHLRLDGERARLSDDAPIGALRPRADLTIVDVAKRFGSRTVLVVLTGMGNDGLDGAREVRRRGGRILVEAEATCTVYGMPRAVAEAGLADVVAPLDDLPAAIAAEVRVMSTSSRRAPRRLHDALRGRPQAHRHRPARSTSAARWSGASAPSRRSRATPDLGRVPRASCRRDKAKVDEFLDRVTINVSQLWRNPEQWTLLGKTILPELAAEGGRVRAWSAGCSYGAEAYTLAAVASAVDPDGRRVTIKGTDIDPRMVDRARRASSPPRTRAARRTAEHASAGSTKTDDGGWRGKPELSASSRSRPATCSLGRIPREAYDLVLCRNTVIYFNEDVRDALHERLVAVAAPRRRADDRLDRARHQAARARPRAHPPLRLPQGPIP